MLDTEDGCVNFKVLTAGTRKYCGSTGDGSRPFRKEQRWGDESPNEVVYQAKLERLTQRKDWDLPKQNL